MKFLCDVHISYKIVKFLSSLGYHAIHVNAILQGSKTKDDLIGDYANENDNILITKDQDFKNSFFIRNKPQRLIKINLGNISNQKLIEILEINIDLIEKINHNAKFIVEVDESIVTYIVFDQ